MAVTLGTVALPEKPDRIRGMAVHSSGSGAGPAIVLLHANGGSARDYDAIIPTLAEHSLVHALDWPGHGDSDPVDNPTACGFADLLPDVLDALPGGPFVLVGNSIGGFAALRTAAQRPDLVRGLVLISPGGFTPRWPAMFAVCALIANRSVTPRAMQWLPRRYLRLRTVFTTAILERMDAASLDVQAVATFASLWRSFTNRCHDARSDAEQVEVPTLLVWGRRDPILPWPIDGRRARARLRNADVVTFACGHQPYAELPQEFLAALTAFLNHHDLTPLS